MFQYRIVFAGVCNRDSVFFYRQTLYMFMPTSLMSPHTSLYYYLIRSYMELDILETTLLPSDVTKIKFYRPPNFKFLSGIELLRGLFHTEWSIFYAYFIINLALFFLFFNESHNIWFCKQIFPESWRLLGKLNFADKSIKNWTYLLLAQSSHISRQQCRDSRSIQELPS